MFLQILVDAAAGFTVYRLAKDFILYSGHPDVCTAIIIIITITIIIIIVIIIIMPLIQNPQSGSSPVH